MVLKANANPKPVMRVSYPSLSNPTLLGLQVPLDAGYQGKTPKDRSGMFLTNGSMQGAK